MSRTVQGYLHGLSWYHNMNICNVPHLWSANPFREGRKGWVLDEDEGA